MRVYISGISGTGMGPLALMAKAAGMEVCGSDLARGAIYDELIKAGIEVRIGEQDGEFLREKLEEGIDWFVHTSALPEGHAELKLARESGVKCTKRDDFTAYLVEKLGLKMVAVAGTHGKTTTTSMIAWAALKQELPVSYIVGTTLGFAPSGAYHKGDKYFIYEADEYDRNFLKYHPWLAVIPAISYDHSDIYPTKEDYRAAFRQFESQSKNVLKYNGKNIVEQDNIIEINGLDNQFKLAGEVRRKDAMLAALAVKKICQDNGSDVVLDRIVSILNEYPGVGRRFERLRDGLYTDYAHHPEEIAATMNIALEECKIKEKRGVVVIYQPHQNVRQHEVRLGYRDVFLGASRVLWLPTYLTREDPNLRIIMPGEFIRGLSNAQVAEEVELGDGLAKKIKRYIEKGYLVLLMTAGPADEWLRSSVK